MTNTTDFNRISTYPTPKESPGFLLWRVSIRWRRAIETALKPFDLTHPQFVILATTGWLTKEGQKISQLDVSRLSGIDPNTISQILRGLQAKGLINRYHSHNEKGKNPNLTPEGVGRLSKALPAVEEADAKFFASLENEGEGFLMGLRKLVE